MKKKILLSFILVIFCVFSVFSEGQDEGSTWKGAPVTIKFYGSTGDYNQNMLKAFAEVEPNIKVEIVPVDFNNAPQIIKTGIASGNPVDVSFFWGSAMKTFTDAGMAHDLTPYLMANNKKWYNTFVPKFIDAGLQNGKYYAISYQPVIETLFVNEEIFKKFNLKYPQTVDEMMETAAFLKTKGIYAFGCWNGMHHQMLVWAYQIYANNGTLDKVTKGQLPFAGPNETPGLRENLELLKKMHEAGYLYPGEGALTISKEQLQAGWYEGKIAMHFDANSDAGKYEKEAPFKVWAIPFPLIKKGGKYGVNVITNALFIPANAKK
jgi:ABC-type glycerol-3-phosphate transport system substrate-binding protein